MASDLVRVVYRKFDGSLHWNQPAWRLGEDEHGVWVGAPAGTPVRLGEQHRVGHLGRLAVLVTEADQGTGRCAHPDAVLVLAEPPTQLVPVQ